jgi:cell division protein FtsI/penicillin-binding protein 2
VKALVCTACLVAGLLPAGPARSGDWRLDAKSRICLAKTLATHPVGEIPMAKRDAFALIDPHTGRILWLRNRRVLAQKAYQPGSIFKIITAYVAYGSTIIDPQKIFHCGGKKETMGPEHAQVQCWLHAGHGPVNLSKALALSCNLYFAHVGIQVGAVELLKAARDFGLGESTGSDLGGEVSGWLPRAALSDHAARMAIGQGKEVQVTPLQMLSAVSAVANGGLLYSPRAEEPGEEKTPLRGELTDVAALRFVRDAMEEASAFGTGHAQRLSRLHLAGKTGTSAWVDKEWKTHAWYIGFAPARNPLVALVVFVHDGQGAKEAAALARQVIETTYDAMVSCGILAERP